MKTLLGFAVLTVGTVAVAAVILADAARTVLTGRIEADL